MKLRFRHKKMAWILIPVSALAVFGMNLILPNYPAFVENLYSRNIYSVIAHTLSGISNPLPFSLSDIFYVFLIISFFGLLVLLVLRKIKLLGFLKILISSLSSIYIVFYVFWGFNYFRQDVYEREVLNDTKISDSTFVASFNALIENINRTQFSYSEISESAIDSLVENAYSVSAEFLRISYPMGKRNDKKITFSSFFAKATISGYYGPFFNEVHVNAKIHPLEYPFVLAHEKAHQFGITSEAEANFYAWLVCTKSSSNILQYSANLAVLRFFVFHGYQNPQFPEIIKKLDEKPKQDYREIQKHWKLLRNEKIDEVATRANDSYLKANKIEAGINDYDGVVKHVINYLIENK